MPIREQQIEELLEHDPFRPFRIVTTSGKEYPVTIPRLVTVLKDEVFYAWAERDRFSLIPLEKIASIDVEHK